MQSRMRWRGWLMVCAGVALGAAARVPAGGLPVQIADTGPLGAPSAKASVPPAVVKASGAMFEAAPVPDESLDAPGETRAAARAELAPALLSAKAAFAGNGFSSTSSQEQATNDRQHPAAGLSLSLPLSEPGR